jgi:hypothetical protein
VFSSRDAFRRAALDRRHMTSILAQGTHRRCRPSRASRHRSLPSPTAKICLVTPISSPNDLEYERNQHSGTCAFLQRVSAATSREGDARRVGCGCRW